LFPGNRTTATYLKPAVLGVESSLDLAQAQRKRTVYRLDGGSVASDNYNYTAMTIRNAH
jgi:hypothetical protein